MWRIKDRKGCSITSSSLEKGLTGEWRSKVLLVNQVSFPCPPKMHELRWYHLRFNRCLCLLLGFTKQTQTQNSVMPPKHRSLCSSVRLWCLFSFFVSQDFRSRRFGGSGVATYSPWLTVVIHFTLSLTLTVFLPASLFCLLLPCCQKL